MAKDREGRGELRSFKKWLDSYNRWTNVCLRRINMDDSMRWDMIIAAGGDDLHNIIKEADIQTVQQDPEDEIHHRPYQEAVVGGPNNKPPALDAVPEQPHVPVSPS